VPDIKLFTAPAFRKPVVWWRGAGSGSEQAVTLQCDTCCGGAKEARRWQITQIKGVTKGIQEEGSLMMV
jgi:hypothetical protein